MFKGRYPDALAQVEDFPYLARFCEENLELEVIRHEVFHMYVASCFFSTMVTEAAEDMEEVAADLFGTLADQMLQKSQELRDFLINVRDRRRSEKNHK